MASDNRKTVEQFIQAMGTSDWEAQERLLAGRLLNAIGPVFGLALVIGLFSLSPAVRTHFFTGINCKIILLQTVIVAIGALGMTTKSGAKSETFSRTSSMAKLLMCASINSTSCPAMRIWSRA